MPAFGGVVGVRGGVWAGEGGRPTHCSARAASSYKPPDTHTRPRHPHLTNRGVRDERALALAGKLLAVDPAQRPSADDAADDDFFWSPDEATGEFQDPEGDPARCVPACVVACWVVGGIEGTTMGIDVVVSYYPRQPPAPGALQAGRLPRRPARVLAQAPVKQGWGKGTGGRSRLVVSFVVLDHHHHQSDEGAVKTAPTKHGSGWWRREEEEAEERRVCFVIIPPRDKPPGRPEAPLATHAPQKTLEKTKVRGTATRPFNQVPCRT